MDKSDRVSVYKEAILDVEVKMRHEIRQNTDSILSKIKELSKKVDDLSVHPNEQVILPDRLSTPVLHPNNTTRRRPYLQPIDRNNAYQQQQRDNVFRRSSQKSTPPPPHNMQQPPPFFVRHNQSPAYQSHNNQSPSYGGPSTQLPPLSVHSRRYPNSTQVWVPNSNPTPFSTPVTKNGTNQENNNSNNLAQPPQQQYLKQTLGTNQNKTSGPVKKWTTRGQGKYTSSEESDESESGSAAAGGVESEEPS